MQPGTEPPLNDCNNFCVPALMPFLTRQENIAVNIIHVFVLLNNLGWVGWYYICYGGGRKYGYSTLRMRQRVLDGVEELHFGIILSSSGFFTYHFSVVVLNCDLRSFDVAIYAYKEVPPECSALLCGCNQAPPFINSVSCPK